MFLAKIYFCHTSAYYQLLCYYLKSFKTADLPIKSDIIGLRENENSEYWHNPKTHFFRKTPQNLHINVFKGFNVMYAVDKIIRQLYYIIFFLHIHIIYHSKNVYL